VRVQRPPIGRGEVHDAVLGVGGDVRSRGLAAVRVPRLAAAAAAAGCDVIVRVRVDSVAVAVARLGVAVAARTHRRYERVSTPTLTQISIVRAQRRSGFV